MSARLTASLATVIIAVLAFVYFIADDTPEPWLIRAAFAGALTAGVGVALLTLADLLDDRRRKGTP